MVVGVRELLNNLDELIVSNLAKTGEEMTFSMQIDGTVRDFVVHFAYDKKEKYKANVEDMTSSEEWGEALSVIKGETDDMYASIERTLKSLPSGLIMSIVESKKNIHFSYGKDAGSLRQIDIKGYAENGQLRFEISIDKLFRGPLSLLNGMVSEKKTVTIQF